MHRPFCICFLLAIVAGLATSTIDTKAKVMALRDALDSVLNDNEQQFEARADSPVACTFHACTAEILGCAKLEVDERGCKLCKCADEGVVIEQPTPCTYHSCTAEMLKCAGSLAKDENGCEKCECAAFDEDFGVELPAEPLAESTVDKGRCMLKPDAGPCRGKHQRYYFDRSANSCQKFIYGGCHGNNNNFQTYEECNVACVKGTVKAQEPQDPVPCLLHGCTAKILNCPGELALNENGCELCECAGIVVEQPTACQYHACTAKMLGCSGSLAKDEKGCELCACADLDQAFGVPFPEKKATAETNIDKGTCMLSPQKGPCRGKHIRYYFDRSMNVCQKFNYGGCHGNGNNFETYEDCVAACKIKDVKPYAPEPPVENLVPCPYHACTAEMLGCTFGLAKNDNECELCKCEGEGDVIVEPEFPCPYHSCTAEMLGCSGELAKNENGCKLCECADEVVEEPLVPCPAHVCTAEMLGCVSGLVKNENGCELCECEEPVEEELALTKCQEQRESALAIGEAVQDGPFAPKCLEDGSFSPVQCYWDECWCVVNLDGKEVPGTRVANQYMETLNCDEPVVAPPKPLPDIEVARRELELALKKLGVE